MFLSNILLKKISLTVLIAFSLSVPDVPAWLFSGHGLNPKTCCGRQICQCKHAKGAFCPLRGHDQKKPALPPAASQMKMGEHCHLHKTAAPAVVKPGKKPSIASQALPSARDGWTKAPCHSDQTKSTSPGYEKTFTSSTSGFVGKGALSSYLVSTMPVLPAFLTDKRLDRPPHSLLLS